ncbi:MFS transporter [Actinoplanes sp. NPDC051861]|uniref:MFS transporter n=1 Tax=Actinoplanes sp. NPDC051861 TaxID=3155170 RepID=UPI00344A2FE2
MRRNATLFVLISLFSGFGGTAMTLAAGIWILDLTGSAALAALASFGIYAPSLAAPWLGVLVDRLPRRALLVTVDVVVGLSLLGLLTVRSPAQAPLIYLVLLVRGLAYVLLDAAETALLPAAIPASRLGDVNGWRSSAQEGMRLLAPLAGAALYTWGGPVPIVVVCAVLPLVTAGLYGLVRLPAGRLAPASGGAGPGRAPGGVWSEVRAGMVALWRGPARTPVLVASTATAVSGMTNAAVLSRVVDGLHLPATHLGCLASAQGAGSVIGGVLAGRLLARIAPGRLAVIGAVTFGVACVAWTLPWWPMLIGGSVLAGLGLPWTLIAALTAIQLNTPDHLLGRVAATGNMLMFGAIAPAVLLGAALVLQGARLPLLLGAAVVFTSAVVVVGRSRISEGSLR